MRRKWIKFLGRFLILVILAAVGLGVYTYLNLKGIIDDPGTFLQGLNKNFTSTVTYKGEKYAYNRDISTLVFLGTDASTTEGRKELGARSDTMIVCAIDSKHHTAEMIVLPRDTRAKIEQLNKDGSLKKQVTNKLNAAFPYGNGNNDAKMGAKNTLKAIERILELDGKYDIPLEKYGGINMDAIVPLNDAVGGVTVTLKQSVPGVGKKGETVTLKGEQAFNFCVMRKGAGLDGSDIARGQRQMQFMFGLAHNIRSMDAGDIVKVYNAVSKNAFTNLSTSQMVAYASILKEIPEENIKITQLKGTAKTINGGSYWVLDEQALEQTIIDIFYIKQ